MVETAGKVSFACAIGAGIGSLIALQLWQPLWWLGALVGSLIGYLAYEPAKVLRAIPLAWRMAGGYISANWRDALNNAASMIAFFSVGLPLYALVHFWTADTSFRSLATSFLISLTFPIFMGVMVGFARFTDPGLGTSTWPLRYNFFTVYGYYLWPGLWYLGRRAPAGIAACARGGAVVGRFIRHLFLLIHSELRLLCGVDALIGAAIGYYAGNPIIGVLAGGLFGVANYILVSRWWLGLVPNGSR